VIVTSYDECGGTITQTWDFTDDCGNPIQYIQTITVDPAPIADWVNPPGDETLSCEDANTYAATPVS
jgi:hypothetical protein